MKEGFGGLQACRHGCALCTCMGWCAHACRPRHASIGRALCFLRSGWVLALGSLGSSHIPCMLVCACMLDVDACASMIWLLVSTPMCVRIDLHWKPPPWVEEVSTNAVNESQHPMLKRRPLVYVYDLPSIFNSRMLQYRIDKVSLQGATRCMHQFRHTHTGCTSCNLTHATRFGLETHSCASVGHSCTTLLCLHPHASLTLASSATACAPTVTLPAHSCHSRAHAPQPYTYAHSLRHHG